jgi:hypothetical protein
MVNKAPMVGALQNKLEKINELKPRVNSVMGSLDSLLSDPPAP